MASNPHGHSPHGPTLHGIDVASPQGHTFDWQLVAADGVRFAWVKATQGTSHVDPTFRRNWNLAHEAGVLCGAYHFLSPDSDPIAQADYYLRTVGALADDDLHPMLDVEAVKAEGDPRFLDVALRWTEHVEARVGRPVVVYTYPSYWASLGSPVGHPLGERPLWIAHYIVNPKTGAINKSLTKPSVPRTWQRWCLWQTSGNKGPRVPGIPVDVDRDVFWGTEDAFRARFTAEPLRDTDPAPAPSPDDTLPDAPRSRSSQRLPRVDAPILGVPTRDTVPGEAYDTGAFVRSLADDDGPEAA